jgi:hypothetical protein
MIHIVAAAAGGTPLPGAGLLNRLVSDLLASLSGLFVLGALLSAAFLGVGKHSGNGKLYERGREGLIATILGAIVCGGASAIVHFALGLGQTIH